MYVSYILRFLTSITCREALSYNAAAEKQFNKKKKKMKKKNRGVKH